MKRIILTALITLSFCYQVSASDTQKLPLAEQCRKMLWKVDPGTNKYIYYGGKTNQTLNKPRAEADIQALYQKVLDKKIEDAKNALTESHLWGTLNDEKVRQEFCKEEMRAINKIYDQTWQIKEWIISSTSRDCRDILKTTVCRGL